MGWAAGSEADKADAQARDNERPALLRLVRSERESSCHDGCKHVDWNGQGLRVGSCLAEFFDNGWHGLQ